MDNDFVPRIAMNGRTGTSSDMREQHGYWPLALSIALGKGAIVINIEPPFVPRGAEGQGGLVTV